jgi:predicted RNA binding protein with dsRBD fold (UPF0201 family)
MSDVYRVEVQVSAPVQPTEVPERVIEAVESLFPEADVDVQGDRVVGHTRSLSTFSERLHEQAILDTARERLLADRRGDTLVVQLKKAAAFEGVVNFSVGEPDELGEIEVRIRVDHPEVEGFVDQVAPPTEDGEPLT